MTNTSSCFGVLSDQELLAAVTRLANQERHATVALIRSLMEVDARRLYLGEGYPSLFAYCTQVLRLSEHAAYNRIEVARAGRRHPRLLEALDRGSINLTAARLLSSHLTPENCEAVLAAARHRNKRGIEELIASLRPLPDVPAMVRKLPTPGTSLIAAAASAPPIEVETPVPPLVRSSLPTCDGHPQLAEADSDTPGA